MEAYGGPIFDFNLNPNLSRRYFFGMLAAATVFAATNPVKAFSSSSFEENCKAQTQRLVSLTCNPADARRINRQISNAPTYWTSPGRTFHEAFASKIRIDTRVFPTEALSDRYFEIDSGLPLFDSENPCRRIKDMNSVELWHFTHPDVVDDFGVLSPCNERLQATTRDREIFRETAKFYDTDPESWNYQYKRPVSNGKRNTMAHVVTSKTDRSLSGQPANTVLITPYDLFS